MIDYNLARKLKNEGFEMETYFHCGNDKCDCGDDCGPFMVDPPTLSQLIEACGNKFTNLTKIGLSWIASYHKNNKNGFEKVQSPMCSSPEKAVAELWLFNKLVDKK